MKKMLEKKKELEGGSQQAGGKLGRKTEIVSTQLYLVITIRNTSHLN